MFLIHKTTHHLVIAVKFLFFWGVRRFSTHLLLFVFLINPAFADTTNPDINANYLNELTAYNVTWDVATEEEVSKGYDIVLTNGAYYKYTYNTPDGYTETQTRLASGYPGNLNQESTTSKVFKQINYTDNHSNYSTGAAIYNTGSFNVVSSDFIGNSVSCRNEADNILGGAIYNTSGINEINGNFVGNFASAMTNSGLGSHLH